MLEFIKKHILIIIYSIVEALISILLIINISKDESFLKYSIVIINFIASIIIFISYKNIRSIYFCISYFFICLGDYGLTILGDNYALSVTYFLFAQLALMLMIGLNKTEMLIRFGIIIVSEIMAIIICKDLYSILVFITMAYISTFLSNIIFGFIKKENIIILIGLILFIMCDICVGISNFELFTNEVIVDICDKLVFWFYIPGLYLMLIGHYLQERGIYERK